MFAQFRAFGFRCCVPNGPDDFVEFGWVVHYLPPNVSMVNAMNGIVNGAKNNVVRTLYVIVFFLPGVRFLFITINLDILVSFVWGTFPGIV